ncbi:MAG: hypothetical protein RJB65_1962 [Actinomycetota bacterium]
MATKVIVVGGGPVGVAMATECARHGFEATVVEKATEVYDLPRAIVMDDEIQRALVLSGMAGLDTVTSPLPGAEFVNTQGERIIGFEMPDGLLSGLGYPPVVRYYQPQLEVFMRDAARRAGVSFLLGDEVVEVSQDATSVTARLANGSTLEAAWLIAADGAASPIRKALGLRFDSLGFDQDWLVVDTELHEGASPALPRLVQQICDPARPSTFVPGHDRYRRWEFQLQEGETWEEMARPETVWRLLSPWLTPADARLVRSVVYRFHATVASSMRSGRVFIAGDAGHQMPPFLGQGLCSGVRDAANLGWKLALVDRGLAGDALLDTYDAERRPHATAVVAHAADTGKLIDQLSGRGGEQESLDAAYGGQRPFPHLEHGFRAGDHFLVGHQAPDAPTADGRTLDVAAGNGFAVVVTPGVEADAATLSRWTAIGASVMTAEMPFTEGVVVVRPDRYVASVSTADEFAAHTAQLMGYLSTGETS